MELLELDKRHLLKQYSILNMVAGLLISFILITLIMVKFWLSIAFTITLAFTMKPINRKAKMIRDAMK